ncbi:hypothetical protein LSTR_LSTR011784 [Laodelphax striatellus]|uniref:Uncharacterized protein n=1 Tax=Laodelphax striatellus TaxID=195883 RepID=A0A482WTB0_LAOST|nr:hypothetical protein LSTR_LSTR011784 [Laodelphax striatellus]
MDTELYIHRSSANNNNAPPVSSKKRWSVSAASNNSSLERLDEEETPEAPASLRPPLPPSGGRRKSWHVGRLDYRKRRKASAGNAQGEETHNRQKRHSWWAVFLPDHFGSRKQCIKFCRIPKNFSSGKLNEITQAPLTANRQYNLQLKIKPFIRN